MPCLPMNPILPNLHCLAGVVLAMVTIPGSSTLKAQSGQDLWFRTNVPGLTADLHSVAYGNGYFVAVGADSTVARSLDGIQWTVGSAGEVGSLSRVRFLNGEFVAMGPTHQLLFSSDGLQWTPRSFPGALAVDVAYGNGVYVAATDIDPYYSTDGFQWQPIESRIPNSFPWETPNSAELRTVLFAEGHFVGLRAYHPKFFGPTSESITSTNGLDWTLGAADSIPVEAGRGTIDYGLGWFTYAAQTPGNVGLRFSDAGESWQCVGCNPGLTPTSYDLGAAFTTTSGVRVMARSGLSGLEPHIFATTNGVDWTTSLQFPSPIDQPNPTYFTPLLGFPRAVAAGGGGFVVVGDGGYILHSGVGAGVPNLVTQPAGLRRAVGQEAVFKVSASGAPPLSYQWYHDDQAIAGATNDSYRIAEVKTADAGRYHVTVSSPLGSVTSDKATLEVAFLQVRMYAGVELDGVVGRTYRIEATETVGPTHWQTVGEVVLPSSHYVWFDLTSPDHAARLYRATELP